MPAPKDLKDGSYLHPVYFVLNDGSVFVDKKLPVSFNFDRNVRFDSNYFIDLHRKVSSLETYNFNGARISLAHSNINVTKIREFMPKSFEDLSVVQYLEFGFPLGLVEDFVLQPTLKNHSSSYEFYSHVDKFVSNELVKGGLTGPLTSVPFKSAMTSPLMTAPKKPDSRRAIFDASFGDFSLNMNTPEKCYLLDEFEFTFPKVDDFGKLILQLGRGAYMWKRDLSRFFLQLPLDPLDFDKVCFVWRGFLFFFTSYIWGCRHAGMNGQRVSNLISAVHRSIGCNDSLLRIFTSLDSSSCSLIEFNTLNYSDDFCGAEADPERAAASFDAMGRLLTELGFSESLDKAVSPRQVITFLGIEFCSVSQEMRVNAEKCEELSADLILWIRRTVACKSELQSILGKLIWISKAVRFSRSFVCRMINEIKNLKSQKQKVKLSDDLKKDFLWWHVYMGSFNGVQLLVSDEVSFQIAGDACVVGLGCYNPSQNSYFSRKLPLKLQDSSIPIHLKEFLCVILSVKIWGKFWTGKTVQIFSDNDSVVDVISNLKPKDLKMQAYLREFLFWVCRFNFNAVASKIGTKDNDIADFLSRNFDDSDAITFFEKETLPIPEKVEVVDTDFEFVADW